MKTAVSVFLALSLLGVVVMVGLAGVSGNNPCPIEYSFLVFFLFLASCVMVKIVVPWKEILPSIVTALFVASIPLVCIFNWCRGNGFGLGNEKKGYGSKFVVAIIALIVSALVYLKGFTFSAIAICLVGSVILFVVLYIDYCICAVNLNEGEHELSLLEQAEKKAQDFIGALLRIPHAMLL